jgi:hypothetical protein
MSTWLYQFWLFSVRTAKNWGRGPRLFTADLLGFNDLQDAVTISSPNTPGLHTTIFDNDTTSRRRIALPDIARTYSGPSPLCRWTIHVVPISYKPLPDLPEEEHYNPYDESTWKPWKDIPGAPKFDEILRNGLESNDFSNLKASDLPIAVPQVIKAAQKSPDELLLEAFGFSIIGRNEDLIRELADQIANKELEVRELYPFHLATSYLDGSRTCCNMIAFLIRVTPLRQSYINSLGHTVLDNLMIAILKAHTSCAPGDVDNVWQKEKRFVGEEVDICGRYDADSNCVQTLLKEGEATIPFEWKHKFCHTSAQTICHCINTIFISESAPDINTASGLFLKRCSHCGLKLQLYPLHCMVLTAFALAQQGTKGEDLFGILACVLCLLWHDADPLLAAPISLAAFYQNGDVDKCSHEELYAVDLAEKLMVLFQDAWTDPIRTGWQLFCFLLRSSLEERKSTKPTASDEYHDGGEMKIDSESDDSYRSNDNTAGHNNSCEFTYWENPFGNNKDLGTFHAAIQTEMVTYRRLAEGDAWTSNNFNMQEILWSLTTEEEPKIGFVENGLMKQYCKCGIFIDDSRLCVCADQACKFYFMNLENWSRMEFIELPDRDWG